GSFLNPHARQWTMLGRRESGSRLRESCSSSAARYFSRSSGDFAHVERRFSSVALRWRASFRAARNASCGDVYSSPQLRMNSAVAGNLLRMMYLLNLVIAYYAALSPPARLQAVKGRRYPRLDV